MYGLETQARLVQPTLGIALKILSALAFTLMSAGVKQVSADYPVGEVVFFRSAFAIAPLLAWLAWRGDLFGAIRTANVGGHVLRGITGSCGMFANFLALSLIPLSDSVAIGYAAPLITVVLAALVLKETVSASRWTAVAIGFAGVLLMLLPYLNRGQDWSGGSAVGALFALFAAFCAAGATVQVRRLTATETTGAIVLYFSLLTSALGLATIVLGWRAPGWGDFGLLVVTGVLGGVGQILLTQSYRHADASLIAPFDYTAMVWALLIGWFAFGDAPQGLVIAGGLIVVGAGLFVLWRERRLGLRQARAVGSGARRPA